MYKIGLLLLCGVLLWAQGPVPERDRGVNGALAEASLEELMNMEISSVARKQQKISRTAAAVFVITQEDIRRSGAVSLPEVLRLAPGLQVARIDGGKWAVSSRGFNGRFANKMLVLIDGRSIYTQLYSGTYWDQYDILLEDIERIEVIRGPGATTWGANAMNGVINIITKPAQATTGGIITQSAGPNDDRYLGVRYGGKAGRKVSYRLFSRVSQSPGPRGERRLADQSRPDTERGGGRVDWEINSRDTLTVHADAYRGDSSQYVSESISALNVLRPRAERTGFDGGYLLARWKRTGERSETAVQWYLNDENRREGAGNLCVRTLDLDFQNRVAVSKRHDLVWGAGVRKVDDEIRLVQQALWVNPESRRTGLASSFVQDDISLVRDRLVLTVGSKFIAQEYSGFDSQPGVRLFWAPATRHSLWASVTRAVRTPSRRDQDISFEFALPASIAPGTYGRYQGSRSFRSEKANTWEVGYRHQFGERFSLDLAAFRSQYSDLQRIQPGTPVFRLRPEVRITVPFTAINGDRALNQGGEAAAQWKPASSLRLSGSYSYLTIQEPSSVVRLTGPVVRDPRHQGQARLSWDPTRRVTFDAFVFRVSALGRPVPGYTRADVRLGWRFRDQWEISGGGRNLLDNRHPEFIPEDFIIGDEIRRSAYIRLTWRFR